jgi:DNA processing protein
MSFVPNQLSKQGAKLVTSADDGIEELPTPVRAVLVEAEAAESRQRNLLAADGLNGSQETIYDLLNVEEPKLMDEIAVTSGLNLIVVLATLLDLERKGMVRQIPGKQFSKVLLQRQELAHRKKKNAPKGRLRASVASVRKRQARYI